MALRDFGTVTPVLPVCELPHAAALARLIPLWRLAGREYPHLIPLTSASSTGPVSTLRGASVEVDGRRVARALVLAGLAGLAVAGALLFVAGAQKNARITRLQEQSVHVVVTVGGCQGLLGGSGSNAAGYACWGSFTLGARHYREGIPGDVRLAPGTTLDMRTVPGAPTLLDTPKHIASAKASGRVFVLPSVLLAGALLGFVFTVLRRRRQPASRSRLGFEGGTRLGGVGGV